MIAGNAAQWDDFFQNKLLPSVFTLVRDAWNRIPKPAPDELEKDTSLHLYCAMLQGKDRQKHPFRIGYENLEIDVDLMEVIGRKDIVFFPPSNDDDVYFCLEAKRLNALVSGGRRSLATEYVKDGMQRFINGKYSRHVHHGGMLGYVLDGNVEGAMKKVAAAIRKRRQELGMESPGEMLDSSVRPNDAHTKETHHTRKSDATFFQIHHIFSGL